MLNNLEKFYKENSIFRKFFFEGLRLPTYSCKKYCTTVKVFWFETKEHSCTNYRGYGSLFFGILY
jgi:hypothetical protein